MASMEKRASDQDYTQTTTTDSKYAQVTTSFVIDASQGNSLRFLEDHQVGLAKVCAIPPMILHTSQITPVSRVRTSSLLLCRSISTRRKASISHPRQATTYSSRAVPPIIQQLHLQPERQ